MISSDLKTYVKRMLIVVPIVGITISLIYFIAQTSFSQAEAVINISHSLLYTVCIWIGVASIVHMLWKVYPWEQRALKHLILEIILIGVYTNGLSFGIALIEIKLGILHHHEVFNAELGLNIFITNLITFFITAIHEAVFFYQQWKVNFSKSARLEKANIEAKYETLKSQINPHFLFNSLNSLTSIVDDNNEAVDYIQNLSEFLRYVLKSRDRELVLVRDEAQVLHKYLSLQKSRFRDNLILDVNIEEKYFHYSLPPLVLQMLVENCIKHNIISKTKPLTIKIFIENESVVIVNNLQKKIEVNSTQTGLKNIIDRIAFFTHREVKVIENHEHFRVEIPLLIVEL